MESTKKTPSGAPTPSGQEREEITSPHDSKIEDGAQGGEGFTIDGDEGYPLIPAARYHAIVERSRTVKKFRRTVREFIFRITELGPYNGVRVSGFCDLGDGSRVAKGSKLARWARLLGGRRGRRAQIPFRAFEAFVFVVEVVTVLNDWKRREHADVQRYSVVGEVIDVAARRVVSIVRP